MIIPFRRSARWIKPFLKRVPLVQAIRRFDYDQRFADPQALGLIRGVFENFEQARRAAPNSKPLGFEVPDYPLYHLDRLEHVLDYDYPVLFWLSSLLSGARIIFDFGGNVGVHYYSYENYLTYPPNLHWIVCDLPEVTALGARIAKERDKPNILFTNDFRKAEGSDVLIAAGVLQYVEEWLADRLATLNHKPRHLLLNKLPLCERPSFVTLQNAGPIFAPEHIFNRAEFLASLEKLDYRLVDAWEIPGRYCTEPFHPDAVVTAYSGLYFRLAS